MYWRKTPYFTQINVLEKDTLLHSQEAFSSTKIKGHSLIFEWTMWRDFVSLAKSEHKEKQTAILRELLLNYLLIIIEKQKVSYKMMEGTYL